MKCDRCGKQLNSIDLCTMCDYSRATTIIEAEQVLRKLEDEKPGRYYRLQILDSNYAYLSGKFLAVELEAIATLMREW